MRADRLPSLRRVWREHRRALGIWAAALAALIVFYLACFPMMGEEMMVAIEGMPEGLMAAMGYQDAGTPEGYTNAVVYRLLGPVLLLVYAIGLGGRVIAGQEEDGSLELDLTAPVSRARLYVERLLASWLLLSVLVAAATLAVLLSTPLFDLGLEPARVLAASLGLWLLVGGFLSVAFALGAASGRRAAAVGGAAAMAALTYVFQGVADGAGIELLAALSPFSWFLDPDPLATGLHAGSLLQLLLVSLVAALLGLWRFGRRDLMT